VVLFRHLSDLAAKVAALRLNHEESIGRMTHTILALLPSHLAQANAAQDTRVWQLLGILSNYPVRGILSGINAEPQQAKEPVFAHCGQPQSN
jgi:hypothetical protein